MQLSDKAENAIVKDNDYARRWRQATPIPSGVVGISRAYVRNALLFVLSTVNKSSRDKFLRCLLCHNVFDDQKKDFERVILKLMGIGRFVNTDTCIKMLKGGREIDNRYFHLSFDDGFRNNFTNAYPILRKLQIPATFFILSAIIGADREKAKQYCLETTRFRSVIEILKWDDLKEITSSGYEIGSHTRTHVQLSKVSHDLVVMEDEILGSKVEIESKLGTKCRYISWPYGLLTDIDEESFNIARSAGYDAAFCAFRGSVLPMRTDIFSIPRHQIEMNYPIAHIEYFARGNMEK